VAVLTGVISLTINAKMLSLMGLVIMVIALSRLPFISFTSFVFHHHNNRVNASSSHVGAQRLPSSNLHQRRRMLSRCLFVWLQHLLLVRQVGCGSIAFGMYIAA
jgi:hypothetical protein